jgi:CDP-paratose 2-epimerase
MKWIITGGAGFIGCHAAARFHERGHDVVVVDNLSRRGARDNLEWLREQGVDEFIKADVRDARAVTREMSLGKLVDHRADVFASLVVEGEGLRDV